MRYHNYTDHDKYLAYIRRYREKTGSGLYRQRAYTPSEDNLIMAQKMPDSELSLIICRSVKAIQNRRRRIRRNYAE